MGIAARKVLHSPSGGSSTRNTRRILTSSSAWSQQDISFDGCAHRRSDSHDCPSPSRQSHSLASCGNAHMRPRAPFQPNRPHLVMCIGKDGGLRQLCPCYCCQPRVALRRRRLVGLAATSTVPVALLNLALVGGASFAAVPGLELPPVERVVPTARAPFPGLEHRRSALVVRL